MLVNSFLRDNLHPLKVETYAKSDLAMLLPSASRAIGIGMCSVASRIGGIISPLVLLWGRNVPSIVFGCSAIVAGILVFFLPETKGQKLPQTLEEAEAMGK